MVNSVPMKLGRCSPVHLPGYWLSLFHSFFPVCGLPVTSITFHDQFDPLPPPYQHFLMTPKKKHSPSRISRRLIAAPAMAPYFLLIDAILIGTFSLYFPPPFLFFILVMMMTRLPREPDIYRYTICAREHAFRWVLMVTDVRIRACVWAHALTP